MRGLTGYLTSLAALLDVRDFDRASALERTPGLNSVLKWMDRIHIDIEQELRKLFARYTQDISALVEGFVVMIPVFEYVHVIEGRVRVKVPEGARLVTHGTVFTADHSTAPAHCSRRCRAPHPKSLRRSSAR